MTYCNFEKEYYAYGRIRHRIFSCDFSSKKHVLWNSETHRIELIHDFHNENGPITHSELVELGKIIKNNPGRTVHLTLEPGDATRYNFIINYDYRIICNDLRPLLILTCLSPSNSSLAVGFHHGIPDANRENYEVWAPLKPHSKPERMDLHSFLLLADIFNFAFFEELDPGVNPIFSQYLEMRNK